MRAVSKMVQLRPRPTGFSASGAAPGLGRHVSLEGVLEGGEGAQLGADPVGVPRVVSGVLGHQPGVALVAVYGAAQALRDAGCVR